MAEEAVRGVLEQLLVALGTPKNREPRWGTLLVALMAGGGQRSPPCTLTVAATGPFSRDLDPEALGGAPRGVQELPGVPPNPSPCCQRILARAQVQRSFQICHPPLLPPARGSLWRFLHQTSLVHPEVEFHFCINIDGNVTSQTLSPERPWAQAGVRLRVQSWHFTGPPLAGAPPPCSRLCPALGVSLPLRVPPQLAAAGFGGDLELLPVTALSPPGTPGMGAPLHQLHLYLFDPAGVPVPPPAPPALQDPSLLGDWGGFGLAVTPKNPTDPKNNPTDPKNRTNPRELCEDEEVPLPPDVTFGVRWDLPGGDGDPQIPLEGVPKTLLVFLFLRHRDPFGGYDAATRQLLLPQLDTTLRLSRPALTRGLQTLLQPILGGLLHHHQARQRVAQAQAVAVAAVTAVVAASSSARFRSACLGALQVQDTPALAVAARRRDHPKAVPGAEGGAAAGGGGGGRAPEQPRPGPGRVDTLRDRAEPPLIHPSALPVLPVPAHPDTPIPVPPVGPSSPS